MLGGIFTLPFLFSAVALPRLALVTGQELLPLVSYGLVVLVVVLVDGADVFDLSPGL